MEVSTGVHTYTHAARPHAVRSCPPRLGRPGAMPRRCLSRGSRWSRRPKRSSSRCRQPHGKRRTGTACMVTPSLHEPGAHARDASSPQVAARRHRRQLVHVTRRVTTSSCGAGLLAGCRTLQAPRVAPRAASGGSSCGRTLCPFEVGVGLVHGHGARECTTMHDCSRGRVRQQRGIVRGAPDSVHTSIRTL